jgi:hypothetical protein
VGGMARDFWIKKIKFFLFSPGLFVDMRAILNEK